MDFQSIDETKYFMHKLGKTKSDAKQNNNNKKAQVFKKMK